MVTVVFLMLDRNDDMNDDSKRDNDKKRIMLFLKLNLIFKKKSKVTPAPPTIMVVESASKASAEANKLQLNIN